MAGEQEQPEAAPGGRFAALRGAPRTRLALIAAAGVVAIAALLAVLLLDRGSRRRGRSPTRCRTTAAPRASRAGAGPA